MNLLIYLDSYPPNPSYGGSFGVVIQQAWQGSKTIQWLFTMGFEKSLTWCLERTGLTCD